MNPTVGTTETRRSLSPSNAVGMHHSGSLSAWMASLSRVPLLTAVEEKSLARRSRNGDDEAHRRLIVSNLRLVVQVATRYAHPNIPLIDLIQEGNIGLMHAVERYDPEKDYRFSTYAVWWIRRSILRALTYGARLVRLPENVHNQTVRLEKATTRLRQQFEREPNSQELSDTLGIPSEQVIYLASLACETVSLDSDFSEEGPAYKDWIEDASQHPRCLWERWNRAEDVERILKVLPLREQAILRARYGLDTGSPLTLKQTGAMFHLTRERIRQIESRALAHLKDVAKRADLSFHR